MKTEVFYRHDTELELDDKITIQRASEICQDYFEQEFESRVNAECEEVNKYLENRLIVLDYELGYFEDDDEGNCIVSVERTKKEINEVKKLLKQYNYEK